MVGLSHDLSVVAAICGFLSGLAAFVSLELCSLHVFTPFIFCFYSDVVTITMIVNV